MATFSVNSSSAATLPQEPSRQAGQAGADKSRSTRKGLAKRFIVGCARKVHDLNFAFPTWVRAFRGLQRAGINVTPNHFYYPVPDLAELEQRSWPIYSTPPDCKFEIRKHVQLAWELSDKYGQECRFPSEENPHCYHHNNGYFEAVDAEIAYAIVRQFKPSRIVEIGTGYSTRLLAAALKENAERDQRPGKIISVDPQPERFSQNGWSNLVVQVPKAVQDLELDFFSSLENGDILFIDSSHVVGVGSDVVREYLEVLPRLKRGVLVHVHDIFLPADYPRDAVLHRLWFWSEQYLLQAFLTFNSKFEVLWASSAMLFEYPSVLEHCFPRWRNSYVNMPESKRRFVPTPDGKHVWPSSFWMRRL